MGPKLPQANAGVEPTAGQNRAARVAASPRVRTHRVELQIQRRADVVRDNLSTAAITIPLSIRTRATISAMPSLLESCPAIRSARAYRPLFPLPDSRRCARVRLASSSFTGRKSGGEEQAPPAEAQRTSHVPGRLVLRIDFSASYRILSGQLSSLRILFWGRCTISPSTAFVVSLSSPAQWRAHI